MIIAGQGTVKLSPDPAGNRLRPDTVVEMVPEDRFYPGTLWQPVFLRPTTTATEKIAKVALKR